MLTWSEPRTVGEIEMENSTPASTRDELRRPFGFLNPKWESLKAKMLPGDEIRRFSSDEASWQALGGRMGVALIRDGKVVDEIITLLN